MCDDSVKSPGPKRSGAMHAQDRPVFDVAVVAVRCEMDGRPCVLLTRRGETTHLAGMWELPGGKIEQDEPPEVAARRELMEETGLEVAELRSLGVFSHEYSDRVVRLHAFAGQIKMESPSSGLTLPVEHLWIPAAHLTSIELPPANRPITACIIRLLK